MNNSFSFFPELSMDQKDLRRPLSFFQARLQLLLQKPKEAHIQCLLDSVLKNRIQDLHVPLNDVLHGGASIESIVVDATQNTPGFQVGLHLLRTCPEQIVEGLFVLAWLLGLKSIYVCFPSTAEDVVAQWNCVVEDFQKHNFLDTMHLCADFKILSHVTSVQGSVFSVLDQSRSWMWEVDQTLTLEAEIIGAIPPLLDAGLEILKRLKYGDEFGTKVVGLFGHIHAPQVTEVPLGTPLKKVINDVTKGVVGGWRHLGCIFVNGPFSRIIPPTKAEDLLISYKNFQDYGFVLGDANFIVVNKSQNLLHAYLPMLSVIMERAKFSCVFCRKGLPWLIAKIKMCTPYTQRQTDKEITYIHDMLHEQCSCGYYQKVSPFLAQAQSVNDTELKDDVTLTQMVVHE